MLSTQVIAMELNDVSIKAIGVLLPIVSEVAKDQFTIISSQTSATADSFRPPPVIDTFTSSIVVVLCVGAVDRLVVVGELDGDAERTFDCDVSCCDPILVGNIVGLEVGPFVGVELGQQLGQQLG